MLGMFCYTDGMSKDHYKKRIKRQLYILCGLFIIGILTVGIALLAEYCWKLQVEEAILSGYLGFGIGLALAGVLLSLQKIRLLKDETRLKKAKIEASDERNVQISIRATRIAVAVLLIGMYFGILIGGLWYPVLMTALSMLVCLFVAAYIVAYMIISKKM